MKILAMIGTRPEAIKVAPVIKALRQRNDVDVQLCNTGQHREMTRQALSDFDLVADFDLDVMVPKQSLAELSSRLFAAIDPVLEQECPDWVLVQGDTMTVQIGALCAFYRHIHIGHIEAGLRTYNLRSPFPEEANRQIVSRIADLHFAPTPAAVDNLLREGTPREHIVLTGNTVIDALLHTHSTVSESSEWLLPEVKSMLDQGKRMILVTGHRRENFGQSFEQICHAIAKIGERDDVFVFYPAHLNPNVREPVFRILDGRKGILLGDPLPYKRFVAHMGAASIVLTDSGGIQEEAPSLGKPVLVMRDTTERPEAVDSGAALLVGTDSENIINAVTDLLDDADKYKKMAHVVNPFGDGQASLHIIDALMKAGK